MKKRGVPLHPSRSLQVRGGEARLAEQRSGGAFPGNSALWHRCFRREKQTFRHGARREQVESAGVCLEKCRTFMRKVPMFPMESSDVFAPLSRGL